MEDGNVKKVRIDVAFPVLHGLNGEDGTVQGLFELAGIPYVGCGVLASAVSMDKLYTKIVVDTLGIAQAKYVAVRKEEIADVSVYETIEEKGARLGYSLISNHAFVDGNKRIGIYAMMVFLAANGKAINPTVEDVARVGFAVAAGEMDYSCLLGWVLQNAEVK